MFHPKRFAHIMCEYRGECFMWICVRKRVCLSALGGEDAPDVDIDVVSLDL